MNQNYLKEISMIIFEMQCGSCLADIIGEEQNNKNIFAIRREMKIACKYGPDLMYYIDLRPQKEPEYIIFITGLEDVQEE